MSLYSSRSASNASMSSSTAADSSVTGASAPGVTATTIRIGRYVAKPDLQTDFLARQTGTYDPPEVAAQTAQAFVDIYNSVFEMYGRKVEIVNINGTGGGSDAVAARRDAATAAAKKVFAVVGGQIGRAHV